MAVPLPKYFVQSFQQFNEASQTKLYHVAKAEYKIGEKVIPKREIKNMGFASAGLQEAEKLLETVRQKVNADAPNRLESAYAWASLQDAKNWLKTEWADWSPAVVHIFVVTTPTWWRGDMSFIDQILDVFAERRDLLTKQGRNTRTSLTPTNQLDRLQRKCEGFAKQYWAGASHDGVWEYLCPEGFTVVGQIGKKTN